MLNHLQKTCPVCKNTFYVKPSHFERRVTCSKACGNIFQKTKTGAANSHFKDSKKTITCETCGKEFSYWPSVRKNGKFCSQSCFAKSRTGDKNSNWRGGYGQYYGPNWKFQQERARQRDNYTCQSCGDTEEKLGRNLDVHHKKQFSLCVDYLEANQLENLVCLCRKCHVVEEMKSRSIFGKPKQKAKMYIVDNPFLTPSQAADIIGITVWAVYDAIRRGGIKFVNLCEGIRTRERPRFAIHIDDAKSYKKRYK